jgi:hypothetical protein
MDITHRRGTLSYPTSPILKKLGGDLLMFGQRVRGLAMMPAEMPPVTVPATTVIKLR